MKQIYLRAADHRGGRPQKAKGVKKSYCFATRLNEIERDIVMEKCEKSGLSRSKFLRKCLFDAKIVERLNPETRQLFKKIGGVANNLNQAAHRANADGYPAASSELSQLATEISDMLTETRNA